MKGDYRANRPGEAAAPFTQADLDAALKRMFAPSKSTERVTFLCRTRKGAERLQKACEDFARKVSP